MRPTVRVLCGYTHADLAIMPGTPAASCVIDFIRDRLTEYESNYNKWTKRWEWTITGKFVGFNKSNGIVSVPINFLPQIETHLNNCGYELEKRQMADYTLREIKIAPNPEYHDLPHQVELIAKCSEKTPGIKGLAMQTGKGKTYSAIKAICNLGYAACIIVPGLVDQWIDEIKKYTNLEDDEIYKIQEFDSLYKLMKSGVMPKIFVCSITTMRIYSKGQENYRLLPLSYSQFFEHYGIGVKVVDECHLNFHATVRMDLKCNVPYNLYCTATFTQNNKYAKKIFDVIYPPHIRYGADKYDRYVDCHFYYFHGEVLERKCVRARGYSHMLYEKQLLKTQRAFNEHFDDFLLQLINIHYVNEYKPGNKLLMFCSTIDFVNKVVNRIREKLPQYRTNAYIGNSERAILNESDIIIATVGKAGTGLDLKGLSTVINTVSLMSPALGAQMFGRLRKLNDRDTIYVDICDADIQSQVRHAVARKAALRDMASKYHEYKGLADPTGGIHITLTK